MRWAGVCVGAPLILRTSLALLGSRAPASASRTRLRGMSTATFEALGVVDAGSRPVDAAALAGKRVGLYFAAGWCPMCTGFEPSLLQFKAATESAEASASPVELILVSSDGSEEAAKTRAEALGLLRVDYAAAAGLKTRFRIWAGRERPEFGDGRRSGVPAIVVLKGAELDELAFLPAEAEGTKALGAWPDEGAW